MKKIYGPIIVGMAAFLAAAPVITTTVVKADNTNNSAVTQSTTTASDALLEQLWRISQMEYSDKYDAAQRLTLTTMNAKYSQQLGSSDAHILQVTQQLKAYLDKGDIGYSVNANTNVQGYDINHANIGMPAIDHDYDVYTFDALNKPQTQQLVFDGYTVLDNSGNTSDGKVSMWLDSNEKLHMDPNFGTYMYESYDVNLLKNGDSYNTKVTSSKWTKISSTVTTDRMALLYTYEGKVVGNRALAGHSSWFTDRYATINGEKMYRVATNEWVRAYDVGQ